MRYGESNEWNARFVKEALKRLVTKTHGATTWSEGWAVFVSKSGYKQSDIQDGNRKREK